MSIFVILGFLFIAAMVTFSESRFSPGLQKALNQNFMGVSMVNERAPLVNRKTGLAPAVRAKNKHPRQEKPLLLTFSMNNKKLLARTGFSVRKGV